MDAGEFMLAERPAPGRAEHTKERADIAFGREQFHVTARARLVVGSARKQQRRSEEHTSEHQSLMRISSTAFCSKTKKHTTHITTVVHLYHDFLTYNSTYTTDATKSTCKS